MKCPNCGNEVESRNFCPECGAQLVEKVEVQKKEEVFWSIACSHEESLWCDEMMQTGPSVIAYEYQRLQRLLAEKQTYGAMLQIKDLAEDILKYAVLLGIAYIWEQVRKKEEIEAVETKKQIELLANTVAGPLELGVWRDKIAVALEACLPEGKLKQFVKRSRLLMTKRCVLIHENEAMIDIVHWRNNSIGHGSLGYEEKAEFQNEIRSLLKTFCQFFQANQPFYKEFLVQYKDNTDTKLIGFTQARSLPQGELCYTYEGNCISLDPYMVIYKNEIYFFDTFLRNIEKVDLLSYPGGDKKEINRKQDAQVVERLCEVYQFCENQLSEIRYEKSAASEESPENTNYIVEMEEELNRYYGAMQYEKNVFLDQWLEEQIIGEQAIEKGIFFVQMEEGMGKSTWARSFDRKINSLSKTHPKWNHSVSTKVLYLNSVYNRTERQIQVGLEILLSHDNSNRLILREQEKIELDESITDKRQRLANYLNAYYETYTANGRGIWEDKVVIFFDGFDETTLDQENDFFAWIPKENMLTKGLYLVLLSRTDAELSQAKKEAIKKWGIKEKQRISLDTSHVQYQELMRHYVKKEIPAITEEQLMQLLVCVQNRFLFLKIRLDIYQHTKEWKEQIVQNDVACYQEYFAMLETRYGKKHMKALYQLLYLIASAKEPLDYKELSVLLGEQSISFRLLGHMMDLRNFLLISYDDTKLRMRIASESIQHFVVEQYRDEQMGLSERYLNCLKMLPFVIEQEEDIDSQIYLLTHLAELKDEIGMDALAELLTDSYVNEVKEIALYLVNTGEFANRKKGYAIAENMLAILHEITLSVNGLKEVFDLEFILAKSYLELDRKTDPYLESQMKDCINMVESNKERLDEQEYASMLAIAYNLLSRHYRAKEDQEKTIQCHEQTITYGEMVREKDDSLLQILGDTYHNMMGICAKKKQGKKAREYADQMRNCIKQSQELLEMESEDTDYEEKQFVLRYQELSLDIAEAELAFQIDNDQAFVLRRARRKYREYLQFKEEIKEKTENKQEIANCLYLYLVMLQMYLYVLKEENTPLEEIIPKEEERMEIIQDLEEYYHYPIATRLKYNIYAEYGRSSMQNGDYSKAYQAFSKSFDYIIHAREELTLSKTEEKTQKQDLQIMMINCMMGIQSRNPENRGRAAFPQLMTGGRCIKGVAMGITETEEAYSLQASSTICRKCKEDCIGKEDKGVIIVKKNVEFE